MGVMEEAPVVGDFRLKGKNLRHLSKRVLNVDILLLHTHNMPNPC